MQCLKNSLVQKLDWRSSPNSARLPYKHVSINFREHFTEVRSSFLAPEEEGCLAMPDMKLDFQVRHTVFTYTKKNKKILAHCPFFGDKLNYVT